MRHRRRASRPNAWMCDCHAVTPAFACFAPRALRCFMIGLLDAMLATINKFFGDPINRTETQGVECANPVMNFLLIASSRSNQNFNEFQIQIHDQSGNDEVWPRSLHSLLGLLRS